MIHAATAQACEPSVKRVLDGKPHDEQVASRVFSNLSELFEEMISDNMSKRIKNIERQNGDTMPKAHVGELAVLSGIWWLISYGRFKPTSYALPVTSELEKGSDKGNPYYRTRTDLRFVNGSDAGAKIDIQVKSRRDSLYSRYGASSMGQRKRPYAPWIPIVTPLDFAGVGSAIQTVVDGEVRTKYEGYKRVFPRLLAAFEQSTDAQLDEAYNRFQYRLYMARQGREQWLQQQSESVISTAAEAI